MLPKQMKLDVSINHRQHFIVSVGSHSPIVTVNTYMWFNRININEDVLLLRQSVKI